MGETVIGIYFEGNAHLIETGDEQKLAAECLSKRLKIEVDSITKAANDDGLQLYKITVASWYVFGRFRDSLGQKYKLEWNGGNV